jgi:transposase-like protein
LLRRSLHDFTHPQGRLPLRHGSTSRAARARRRSAYASAFVAEGYPFESGSLALVPTAGHDYPGSHGELLAWFPDDHACVDYLEWLRWPDGFRCARCVSRSGWRLSSGRWECTVCGRQTSVTAGTIFHRTRTPLPTWFQAAWLMTAQKQGVSALGLQRSLGLGSYQTAWAMLHRFRLAMVRPARERLSGWVEVDEAYVGGVEGAVHRARNGDEVDRRDRR